MMSDTCCCVRLAAFGYSSESRSVASHLRRLRLWLGRWNDKRHASDLRNGAHAAEVAEGIANRDACMLAPIQLCGQINKHQRPGAVTYSDMLTGPNLSACRHDAATEPSHYTLHASRF